MSQHIHILGIGGTFMGGLAQLAKALGYHVTGSDLQIYPPMSDQLRAAGISWTEGYSADYLQTLPDLVVVGNAMGRGNPAVEALLDSTVAYCSGPEWLSRELLRDRWVLAVAGTHGKTTTASMLAWILEYAGYDPGFLIGGVPANFGCSARYRDGRFFVVEADEYDTAFFDKRSKFLHYHPRTLILNNLEFDHADIFPDLAAIQRQFHHLLRIVPRSGQVILPAAQPALTAVVEQGCWSELQYFGDGSEPYQLRVAVDDGRSLQLWQGARCLAERPWSLSGRHNLHNAQAALLAARHVGVEPLTALEALSTFTGVKRRQEVRGHVAGITVVDDFAHHPTAIALTLEGLRQQYPQGRLLAVLEPRSNTMKLGVHRQALAQSVTAADQSYWLEPPTLSWSLAEQLTPVRGQVFDDLSPLVERVIADAVPGDCIVVMSNGGFGGIHDRLLQGLESRFGV